MLQCDICTKSEFSHGDKYKLAYWNLRTLYLNVQERVRSDSRFPHSGNMLLQFKISFTLIRTETLMTSIKIPIRAFNVEGNVNSPVISHYVIICILASWKCDFWTSLLLPTENIKYTVLIFRGSIRGDMWNICKACKFKRWIVQTYLLETLAFILKYSFNNQC